MCQIDDVVVISRREVDVMREELEVALICMLKLQRREETTFIG